MGLVSVSGHIYFYDNNLHFKAVRSSGPGGQHVNKVSSKIILTIKLTDIKGLDDNDLTGIKERLAGYLVQGDTVQIESQRYRSQFANRQDALNKLIAIVKNASKKKKRRKKSRTPRRAHEKRLQDKKARKQIKTWRSYKGDE